MKTYLFAALLPALALSAYGQKGFLAPALLIEEGGAYQKVWLVAATKNSIRFRIAKVAAAHVDEKRAKYQSIYIYEPLNYSKAMGLYEGRKYEEAKKLFVEVKESFKPLMTMENSPGVMAAFYELECLRKLQDLEGLSKALQSFIKAPLTRETEIRQLELYVLWDAVRTESWDRLEILAKELAATRLPGAQRAQVAYCHGLALEGLERKELALFAYQIAMTADTGASEVVARQAALRILAIHGADPGVKGAISVWGTDDENKGSKGYADLSEAAAVAALYELSLGSGSPLPDEFKMFLKYRPKSEGA